jgi:site-specific recombinase XerD
MDDAGKDGSTKIVPVLKNRPELVVFRKTNATEADWQNLITAFAHGNAEKRQKYESALRTFLGKPTDDKAFQDYLGQKSPGTRKQYSYAVQEFFEWLAHKQGKIVPPEHVTRADAADFVTYLANVRTFKPTLEKVKDPNRGLDREITAVVSKLQQKHQRPVKFMEIITELRGVKEAEKVLQDAEYRTTYRHQLGRLVTQGVLVSDPTVSELRNVSPPGRPEEKPYADAGISLWEIDGVPYDCVFSYSIVEPKILKRSTISSRVAALSSFWKALMLGDNTEKGTPLLKYNVWDEQKRIINKGLRHETKLSADSRLMSDESVLLMLEHFQARTLLDLRDKAILYLMCFSGIRAQEIIQLLRGAPRGQTQAYGWFVADERPKLRITAKGNKHRVLSYPPAALTALTAFQVALERVAAPLNAQSDNPSLPHYIPPQDKAWFYQSLCFESAPLFPPLEQWGKNSGSRGRVHHMGRNCLANALKRIARSVRFLGDDGRERGLTEDEVSKTHPHALRHFFATAAKRGGMPVDQIQDLLGHENIATTSGYFTASEVVETEVAQKTILDYLETVSAERMRRQVETPKKPAAPPTQRIQFIETTGKTVAAPVSRPAPAPAPLEPLEGLTPPDVAPQLVEEPREEPREEPPARESRIKKPVRSPAPPVSRPLVEISGATPQVAYDDQGPDADHPYAFENDLRLYRFHALRSIQRRNTHPLVYAWFSPEAEPEFRHVEVWDGKDLFILPESTIIHMLQGPYQRPDWFEKLSTRVFDTKHVTLDVQKNFRFDDLQERWKTAFDAERIPWDQFR